MLLTRVRTVKSTATKSIYVKINFHSSEESVVLNRIAKPLFQSISLICLTRSDFKCFRKIGIIYHSLQQKYKAEQCVHWYFCLTVLLTNVTVI